MPNDAKAKEQAEKAAAEKAAADAKAKADADAKAAADKAAADAATKAGDLAQVFDDDPEKAAADKAAADKAAADAAAKAGGDLSLKVPDDLKDRVTEDISKAYLAKAKELGVTQKQLQGLADLNFDLTRQQQTAFDAESDRERDELRLSWKRDLMTDPQLGGAKLKASMALAERGARALGGSALAVKLAQHLRGEEVIDGPTLVRAFHMAGLSVSEDTLGGGGEGAGKDGDAGLSPQEKEFKRMHPETWARMQAEKKTGT